MTNRIKAIGIVCIVVCVLCVAWVAIGIAYTLPTDMQQYRFDGVHAAEGTVLTVKNGQLVALGGFSFSVDKPIDRVINLGLATLCFVMTLISGIVMLRPVKKGPPAATESDKVIRI